MRCDRHASALPLPYYLWTILYGIHPPVHAVDVGRRAGDCTDAPTALLCLPMLQPCRYLSVVMRESSAAQRGELSLRTPLYASSARHLSLVAARKT